MEAKGNTRLMTLALLVMTMMLIVLPLTLVEAEIDFSPCEKRCMLLCGFSPIAGDCYPGCVYGLCPGAKTFKATAHCNLGCAMSKCYRVYSGTLHELASVKGLMQFD